MLNWLRSSLSESVRSRSSTAARAGHSCPGMARALERILSKQKRPEVLDLGQFCRSTAVYLADRGTRVSVEDFEPPPPTPKIEKKDKKGNGNRSVVEPVLPPLSIRQPDDRFDFVLAWEHWDFVPPDRLGDFAAELHRVMAPGAWLLLFAQDDPSNRGGHKGRPGSYRLTADDRILRLATSGPARSRWSHTNRAFEQALRPMTVQSIHLQPDRIREFLIRKKP